jgi:nitrate reductase beta subunit
MSNEVPFVISALFSKTVQTAPYESEKAEISAQCKVEDGADAQATIEGTMSMVRKQVMIALGKDTSTLVAFVETKRGPGRPRKVESQVQGSHQEPQAEKVEKAAPQPVPQEEKVEAPTTEDPDDDDFGDPKDKKIEEITDKALQEACATASKKPGMDASKVKKLFGTKYGTTLVAKIKPEERKDFLADLAALVEANKPKE